MVDDENDIATLAESEMEPTSENNLKGDDNKKKSYAWIIILMLILAIISFIVVVVRLLVNETSNKTKTLSIATLSHTKAIEYKEMSVKGDALGDIDSKLDDTWKCLGKLENTKEDSPNYGKTLFDILSLDKDHIVALGNVIEKKPTDTSYCSSIRKVNDKVEILLIATSDGKYSVKNKDVTYAFSYKKKVESR